MTDKEVLDALSESEILFLTILGEARGERVEGQIAVGNVIMNRSKKRYQTIKEVCLAPYQFSCWNENDPNRIILLQLARGLIRGVNYFNEYKQVWWVVSGLLSMKLEDNTKGSDHYLTNRLYYSDDRPTWSRTPMQDPVRIGNHVFLKL